MAQYILNMGGSAGSASVDAVDVFKTTANGIKAVTGHGLSLSTPRNDLAAASCGNYILAMGGVNISTYYNTVDVFKVTQNGVEHITDHGLSLSIGRSALSAASCGNYILAMGGSTGSVRSNTVDVFKVTENGVEHITDHGLSLSTGRAYLSAAACGNYILAMGGGTGSGASNAVDVFHVTENGVEAVTDHGLTLSTGRNELAAASAGNYILAMGGYDGGASNAVDVFKVTENGVEAVTGHGLSLSTPRDGLAAAACGNYILAMGGFGSSYSDSNAVDVFKVTESGIEHITDHGLTLSTRRRELSAAACGNYILAMGGAAGSGYSNAVDVFQIFE